MPLVRISLQRRADRAAASTKRDSDREAGGGRLIVFTELWRDGVRQGHVAVVINDTLHDATDTRDAYLLGYWRRVTSSRYSGQ